MELLIYFLLSECLFFISVYKYIKYKTSKEKYKYPILYKSEIKTRMLMFGTCIWLPWIVLQKIYEFIKE
jgi:hypothetical protein